MGGHQDPHNRRDEQYRRRFGVVCEIINRHDPARLLAGKKWSWNGTDYVPFDRSIDDEYAGEISGVLRIIEKEDPDENKLRYRMERLFEMSLYPGCCESTDWRALAAELWEASQRAGW